ncbi:hypothetical protein [Silanimonas sp.]|uniref:hypothetical protein n=1 Tax=Silanimonas sp. TaxID=1929290 RepID=UPI0022C32F29|nr:hypothetical protein [Silanimonas sp.]MCZ8166666.1 hypothetical protein [Silanimonas sp.]
MLDAVIPNLKVEGLAVGPLGCAIDMGILLYKGAALRRRSIALSMIEGGKLGRPLLERLPLLKAIHEPLQTAVKSKSLSGDSVKTLWSSLKRLVAFSEEAKVPFIQSNVLNLYLAWAARMAADGNLTQDTKHQYSFSAARLLAPVLHMDAKVLQWRTRIVQPKTLGTASAKENLDETASFIQLMMGTIRQLPVPVIRGPLPVMLRYSCEDGRLFEYQISCGSRDWKPIDSLSSLQRSRREASRARATQDVSNTKRAMLINLRLEAEMLVFINQTSANLTQVLQLTGNFRYQSKGDYVYVRPWKDRAKHNVEFRIEKGYRPHFEAFLKWREAIFPGDPDGLTFPFVACDGDKAMQRTDWPFKQVRRLCKALGKRFVPASQHRDTPGNFVNRNADLQTAAELLSHDGKTFQQHYEEPNHQKAAAELVNFWDLMEAMVRDAVGPGGCQRTEHEPLPEQVLNAPRGAPKPDCEGAAGCLFCPKNRDLRSFDHAWNLASLQHLTLLQFNADHTDLSLKADHPSLVTAERAAAKLDAMEREDDECAAWVAEARLRVQEARYHPHYTHKFESLERGA